MRLFLLFPHINEYVSSVYWWNRKECEWKKKRRQWFAVCVRIDKNSREMNKRRMKPIECRTSHFNKNHAHMRHAIRAGIPFIVTIKKKHKLTEKQQQKKNVDWDICLKSIRSAEPLDSSSQTIQLIANAFLIWMHIQNVGAIHHLTFSENQIEEGGVFSDAIIHTIPNGVCDNFNQLLLCYSIYKYAYWIVKSFERREKTRIQFNSFNIIKIIFPIKIE